MLKKYFRKIVDAIFGKRCECLITKAQKTLPPKLQALIQKNKKKKEKPKPSMMAMAMEGKK